MSQVYSEISSYSLIVIENDGHCGRFLDGENLASPYALSTLIRSR